MNAARQRPPACLAAIAVALCAGRAVTADGHAVLQCATMAKGIAAMQGEVDGLRRSVRRLVRDAAGQRRAGRAEAAALDVAHAALFRSQAAVEQSKIDGMRHNLDHCSKREPPGDAD